MLYLRPKQQRNKFRLLGVRLLSPQQTRLNEDCSSGCQVWYSVTWLGFGTTRKPPRGAMDPDRCSRCAPVGILRHLNPPHTPPIIIPSVTSSTDVEHHRGAGGGGVPLPWPESFYVKKPRPTVPFFEARTHFGDDRGGGGPLGGEDFTLYACVCMHVLYIMYIHTYVCKATKYLRTVRADALHKGRALPVFPRTLAFLRVPRLKGPIMTPGAPVFPAAWTYVRTYACA